MEVELRREFSRSELKDDAVNPDIYFSQIEHIQQRMLGIAVKITDKEVMIHMLDTLPRSYDGIVTLLEADLNKETLDLRSMRESGRAPFKKIEKRRNEDAPAKEVAFTSGYPKQYKGTCTNCGKQGHKTVDCWAKTEKAPSSDARPCNARRGERYKGRGQGRNPAADLVCHKCERKGHVAKDCWGKKKSERANLALGAEETKDDFAFVSCDKFVSTERKNRSESYTGSHDFAFGSVDKLLSNIKGEELTPDMFIGDSAATSNMTFDRLQMYNCAEAEGTVTVGTGKVAKASMIGDIDVTVIKNDGAEYNMTLMQVKYIPDFKVNLISLTRYMWEGWSLGGDDKLKHLSNP